MTNRIGNLCFKQALTFTGESFVFQVDTGTGDNFCDKQVWSQAGSPPLQEPLFKYVGANGKPLPVLGRFSYPVMINSSSQPQEVEFVVSKKPLKLLGRTALRQLGVDINALLNAPHVSGTASNACQISVISSEENAASQLKDRNRIEIEIEIDFIHPTNQFGGQVTGTRNMLQ